MIKFIGEYAARLDDKGRLVFPSAFKALMAAELRPAEDGAAKPTDMQLVIKKDIHSDCLEMFTYDEWSKESEKLKSRLNLIKKDHDAFWREYMRNRAIVEPDGKVGRITIPKKLLEAIGADKDIIFFGADHKIEIWAKEKFDSQGLSYDDFVAFAESISD